MSVRQRFEELLKGLKINGSQLSRELGISQTSVSRILSGSTLPSSKVLIPLVEKYSTVNLTWLLIGEGEMFIPEDSTPVKNKDLDQLSKIIDALETSNEESKKRGATMDKYIDLLEEKIKEMEDIVKKGKYKK